MTHSSDSAVITNPRKPLIESIGTAAGEVIAAARPYYQGETGKRRKGWNAFFDYPPAHPDGTRHAMGRLSLKSAEVRTVGNRVQVRFDGLRMGIFAGSLVYTIFPGSRLIHQEAVVTTQEDNTAYYYDAGIEVSGSADQAPGRNMRTEFAYYDTSGKLQRHLENGLQVERQPVKVRYRTLAAKTAGSAVFH